MGSHLLVRAADPVTPPERHPPASVETGATSVPRRVRELREPARGTPACRPGPLWQGRADAPQDGDTYDTRDAHAPWKDRA
jgi:hypothetical protein